MNIRSLTIGAAQLPPACRVAVFVLVEAYPENIPREAGGFGEGVGQFASQRIFSRTVEARCANLKIGYFTSIYYTLDYRFFLW